MTLRRLIILLFFFILVFAFHPDAHAQDAESILKKVSAILNAPEDQTLQESVEIIAEDGSVKKRTLYIQQKGENLRLIRFVEPANVAGISFLSLGDERMYLYLPAFRKVRRIASHTKNENFMGTDFSYEDLSEMNYSKKYNAILVKDKPTRWVLKLTPKPRVQSAYSYIIMEVEKATNYPTVLELYREDKLFKKMEMSDIKNIGDYLVAGEIKMTTLDSGHQTIIRLQQAKFDLGISDNEFSERNLKRWRK